MTADQDSAIFGPVLISSAVGERRGCLECPAWKGTCERAKIRAAVHLKSHFDVSINVSKRQEI